MSNDANHLDRLPRRAMLKGALAGAGGLLLIQLIPRASAAEGSGQKHPINETTHYWGYAVDTTLCIGCGACMRACRAENSVPEGSYRTWVERFEIREGDETHVDVAKNERATFSEDAVTEERSGQAPLKAFFVPKLCNQCENSVCSQVCPVGANYHTTDGVVLVDSKHCIGCGYCIQACPYGTRFINPTSHTADKCTLCYHRISKGMLPACVQSCPQGARIFGDLKDPDSAISRVLRDRRYGLLKPELGTHPKCYYIGLDLEVI